MLALIKIDAVFSCCLHTCFSSLSPGLWLLWRCPWGFLGGLAVKNPPTAQELQEMRVQSLDQEDPLEEELATHSSILAWRISWSLVGYSPWGHKESDMTEWLTLTISLRAAQLDDFSLGISWRCNQDVDWNCNNLKAWLELEELCQSSSRPCLASRQWPLGGVLCTWASP